ncbi:MAG: dTDP-4-dehydrorhamnose reductase [Sulfuricaulis sp.]
MIRILLTGKNGQIGWELQRTLATLGQVMAPDRHGLDLGNPDSIRRAVRDHKPHVIVNAAAYTDVDKAEAEPVLAMAVNGAAPGILAEEAKRLGATVIHYSTDYVFDGAKTTPYTEEDAAIPLNAYGKCKLAGEQAILAVGVANFIFRTSWVYSTHGRNFLKTILRLAKERDELRIVDDQIGAPTWSRLIAEATAQILARWLPSSMERSGIYHMTAAGQTSWCGFARSILDHAARASPGKQPRLTPIPSSEYHTAAKRPKNSTMSNDKLHRAFGVAMPIWEAGLELCTNSENHT